MDNNRMSSKDVDEKEVKNHNLVEASTVENDLGKSTFNDDMDNRGNNSVNPDEECIHNTEMHQEEDEKNSTNVMGTSKKSNSSKKKMSKYVKIPLIIIVTLVVAYFGSVFIVKAIYSSNVTKYNDINNSIESTSSELDKMNNYSDDDLDVDSLDEATKTELKNEMNTIDAKIDVTQIGLDAVQWEIDNVGFFDGMMHNSEGQYANNRGQVENIVNGFLTKVNNVSNVNLVSDEQQFIVGGINSLLTELDSQHASYLSLSADCHSLSGVNRYIYGCSIYDNMGFDLTETNSFNDSLGNEVTDIDTLLSTYDKKVKQLVIEQKFGSTEQYDSQLKEKSSKIESLKTDLEKVEKDKKSSEELLNAINVLGI